MAKEILLAVTNSEVSGNSIGNNGGYVKQAQSFTITGSGAVYVSGATATLLRGGGTDNVPVVVRIETDSAGLPSGSLAHANATASIPTFTDAGFVTKEVAYTPFTLTRGTKYWLVLETAQSEGAAQFYRNKFGTENSYASHGNSTKSGVGAWSAEGAPDIQFSILGVDSGMLLMF